jgi:steroid delta-isomerase-like uncharacterized protein
MKRLWAVGAVLALALALSGCTELGLVQGPSAGQNKDIVRSFVDAMNNRDYDRLDELVKPDLVRHSQATPGVQVRSLEEFKQFLQQDAQTFPDGHQTIEMMVAEGNKVAVYATYTGTQEGPFGPYPPTGKTMELKFLAVLRLEGEKIAEIWVEWDNLAALTQLGHFSPAE